VAVTTVGFTVTFAVVSHFPIRHFESPSDALNLSQLTVLKYILYLSLPQELFTKEWEKAVIVLF